VLATQAPRQSLYAHCEDEALKFKWIESERAGFDLGQEALQRWVRLFWKDYLRARLIEHLEGRVFWAELDKNDFGLLKYAFQDDPSLRDRIVDRLRGGDENLEIICWAHDDDMPMCRVSAILEKIDINARRPEPHFDRDC
jgi:hypothetical protein